MSAEEFRLLRISTGLDTRAWAILLDCREQSVKNMEGGTPIGKQMALCAVLLAHPEVRARLPAIFRWKDALLQDHRKEE
jgi:hypothetical protein